MAARRDVTALATMPTEHELRPQIVATGQQLKRHYTPEERTRALQASKLCALWGHPGQDVIIRDLENGCRDGMHLTSRDYRNALELYGPCVACLEGKMRAPSKPASQSAPEPTVGGHLHADLIPLKTTSLGGHHVLLAAVDERSSYLTLIPMASKTSKNIADAFEQVILFYNQHGHVVRTITTDNEEALRAVKPYLAGRGVHLTHTPADLHENRIERKIQTLKSRRRAVLAGLSFQLPLELEAESYMYTAWTMNQTSSRTSTPATPYQLVVGKKPFCPPFHFGQVGLFQTRRKDSPDMRAEWGIFLGYGDGPGSLRAYVPNRRCVYSRRFFVPLPSVPVEWNFPKRIRPPDQASELPPTATSDQQRNVRPDLPYLLPATVGPDPASSAPPPPVPTSVHAEHTGSHVPPHPTAPPPDVPVARPSTTPGTTGGLAPTPTPPSPSPQLPPSSLDQEGEDREGGASSNDRRDMAVLPTASTRPVRQAAVRNQGWRTG
eukprot:gene17856-12799_t